MKNIFEIVQEVLLSADKYQSEDNNLLKAKVYSDIMMMDEELLSLLLSNERIKEEFFTKVKDTLIFDKQKFAWLIESKEFLPDSYTRYSNKIGLTSNGNFISQKNDVVLDFPYKDCYLQGGQDKEDQKREEIFYHETIANDEVTRMLAPKVFTNAKRYTKEGIEENIEFKDDDNLIIKGNNLVALSSLLKRYEGKVKLIYIDPPYNTGNDSFGYNDSFNHSTWLTFMKNRLEIAKELLSEDGVIFTSIDRNEFAELKLLMDEIFNNAYLGTVINVSTPNGRDYGSFAQTHDYIHVYGKNREYAKTFALDVEETKYKLSDEISNFYLHPLFNSNSAFHKNNRPNLYYPFYISNKGDVNGFYSVSTEKNSEHPIEVFPPLSQTDGTQFVWRWGKDKANLLAKTELVGQKKSDGTYRIAQKMRPKKQIPRTVWKDAKFSNRRGTEELQNLFEGKVFSFPKPENLLKEIIEIGSEKGDIVLDFHMGSATTQVVAHKMNRRYIGIEQMDYIKEVSVPRLQKVIEGEQGGISKDVEWQGGGSFVYCELLENSNELIKEVQNATNETITDIKEKIYKDERIVPYITSEELEAIDTEFEKLSFEEKKMALCALVDKNKLYVNLSDVDDETYNINDEDRKFTESFYKREV